MSVPSCRGSNRSLGMLPTAVAICLVLGNVSLAQSPKQGKGQAQGQGGAGQNQKAPASQPVDEAFAQEAEPYDLAAIDANPNYYNTPNANRVYQQAPVPAGQKWHPHLEILSGGLVETGANKKLDKPIVVKAQPGRPVTFVALDNAKFANGKTALTVKADKEGKAQAEVVVTLPGPYRVLVGSPENDGPEMIHIEAYSDLASAKKVDTKQQEYEQQIRAFEGQRGGGAQKPPETQQGQGASDKSAAGAGQTKPPASQPKGR